MPAHLVVVDWHTEILRIAVMPATFVSKKLEQVVRLLANGVAICGKFPQPHQNAPVIAEQPTAFLRMNRFCAAPPIDGHASSGVPYQRCTPLGIGQMNGAVLCREELRELPRSQPLPTGRIKDRQILACSFRKPTPQIIPAPGGLAGRQCSPPTDLSPRRRLVADCDCQ